MDDDSAGGKREAGVFLDEDMVGLTMDGWEGMNGMIVGDFGMKGASI